MAGPPRDTTKPGTTTTTSAAAAQTTQQQPTSSVAHEENKIGVIIVALAIADLAFFGFRKLT